MIISNIQIAAPVSIIGKVSCGKLNVQSSVLRGVPDLRPQMFPHVYKNSDKKDRFIPDPDDY